MKLEYVGTDIGELSYKRDWRNVKQVQTQTRINYNVLYNVETSSCIGEFQAEIFSAEDEEQLKIAYCSRSVFKLSGGPIDDNAKRDIHLELYSRLYPLWKHTIENFAASVGVQGIVLPTLDISRNDIVVN